MAGPGAFERAASLEAARTMLPFEPRAPRKTAGRELTGLHVHVRDHKGRTIPFAQRTLEAHYGAFVVSQSRKGEPEARRWALDVSYGRSSSEIRVAGHEGRRYDLGPEVPPDDPDGRSPAVVTWHDGEMHYLLASGQLEAAALVEIALSMY